MKKKIDELGRVVIPKPIRETLEIGENDELEMEIINNSLVIKKKNPMMSQNEIEQIFYDVSNASDKEAGDYKKGFIDALKLILKK